MIAAGIDIGGTKIEAQIFDGNWQAVEKKRISTPQTYAALIGAIADMAAWAEAQRPGLPVGIASAGLINRQTGLALTANLPATGKPFARDLTARLGRQVSLLNDCRAFTLSEAVFGAGRGANPVAGVILGTGLGGGFVLNGALLHGADDLAGEFGHIAAPARLFMAHDLPVLACGCGRPGCMETLISGPGLSRLATALTGRAMSPREVAARRGHDADAARVWALWCELAAELLLALTLSINPEVIVIGGGLARIRGVAGDLAAALARVQFQGFAVPQIRLAEGGDASGARGAAYAAFQELGDA